MAVLVTGGAGYIGSHTVAELLENKEEVIIVDNLERGHKESLFGGKLIIGDLRDKEFVLKIFRENQIDSVIHFAAYIEVGESVKDPLKFYNNNVVLTLNLLDAMKVAGVNKIVFSSTAATYGEPKNIPIKEDDYTLPTNPYGDTKLAVEKALKWSDEAYGIKSTILRYFNACGAHKSGLIGEDHDPETHLIPIIIQNALGKRSEIKIFGDNYNTPDGTCVRDYVHVEDLANAHLLALKRLRNEDKSGIYNLGNGKGFSVKEIINVVKEISGAKIIEVIAPRREGDPATLVASAEKAKLELGWEPNKKNINEIIESAWMWHKNNPNGFTKR